MTTDHREQLLELVERLTTATLDADGRAQLQNLLAGDVEGVAVLILRGVRELPLAF